MMSSGSNITFSGPMMKLLQDIIAAIDTRRFGICLSLVRRLSLNLLQGHGMLSGPAPAGLGEFRLASITTSDSVPPFKSPFIVASVAELASTG